MRRICVLIPNQLVRSVASKVLAGCGFAVFEAATVDYATLLADPPDVFVVDEELGGAFAALYPAVRWVGLGGRGARASLSAAGASCVVEKPFGAEDLLRAVRWVLDVYAGAEPLPIPGAQLHHRCR